MKHPAYKNQYIDRIAERPDRIFSVDAEADIAAAREWIARHSAPYAERVIELGSGSAGHLIDQALRAPERLFIGFELRFKRIYRTIEKAEKAGAANLIVLKCDARALPKLFEPGSVAGVFVNFPDPWDKRRWKKHRLLTPSFLQNILGVLRSEGFFSYKTDHAEYFEETRQAVENTPGFAVDRLSRHLHELGPDVSSGAFTEFESLFYSQRLPVHFLFVKKFPSGAISRL